MTSSFSRLLLGPCRRRCIGGNRPSTTLLVHLGLRIFVVTLLLCRWMAAQSLFVVAQRDESQQICIAQRLGPFFKRWRRRLALRNTLVVAFLASLACFCFSFSAVISSSRSLPASATALRRDRAVGSRPMSPTPEATRRPPRRWQAPAHWHSALGQDLWQALARARRHRAPARQPQGRRQRGGAACSAPEASMDARALNLRTQPIGLCHYVVGATEPWVKRFRNHWHIGLMLILQNHLLSTQASQISFDGEEQFMHGGRHPLGEYELEIG